MDAALYDPSGGYYAVRSAIGEGGDFVTAPTISPLFARAVARAFAANTKLLDGPLTFLEAAAAGGIFLADFRRELLEIDAETGRRTTIWAVERSRLGRENIAKTGAAERIFADAEQIPAGSISGWVFSNELYDALPVHRVEMRDGKLFELGVGLEPSVFPTSPPVPLSVSRRGGGRRPGVRSDRENGSSQPHDAGFVWTSWTAPPELSAYLARFGVVLAEGQIAEINLDAGPLHRALCRTIERGRIVTFDYGHRAPVLYHSHARRAGTLAVHSRGRRGGDPLANPGLVDLTAHVNWDDLAAAGEEQGFVTEPVRRLSRFLLEWGLFQDAERDRIAALRLLDPEGLGDALSVLVQSKGV